MKQRITSLLFSQDLRPEKEKVCLNCVNVLYFFAHTSCAWTLACRNVCSCFARVVHASYRCGTDAHSEFHRCKVDAPDIDAAYHHTDLGRSFPI
jgi:hypothetical protein